MKKMWIQEDSSQDDLRDHAEQALNIGNLGYRMRFPQHSMDQRRKWLGIVEVWIDDNFRGNWVAKARLMDNDFELDCELPTDEARFIEAVKQDEIY